MLKENRECNTSEILQNLFNIGHNKLVPLRRDGKVPMMIKDDDTDKIKKEDGIILYNASSLSWFIFIDQHPNFWTIEKLKDPYYSNKFHGINFSLINEFEFYSDKSLEEGLIEFPDTSKETLAI